MEESRLEEAHSIATFSAIPADERQESREVRLSIEPYAPTAPVDGKKLRITSDAKEYESTGGCELLSRVPGHRRVAVRFSEVEAWAPNMLMQGGALDKVTRLVSRQVSRARGDEEAPIAPSKKRILCGISGGVGPCEVFAMMGPSGSGKTSLLSILGGRTPKLLEVKGSMLFNGQQMTKSIKRRIGFVTQDDLMYETLTVYETLYFAALLRLPKTMSRAEKGERVEAVIAALGLDKCRDTLIGGPMMRGVSGGERKRVSVGHELLTNPSVIMLDEPTSGLDATTAMQLITVLRQLAEGGRAIITTIHQPSSRLYQQLDTLMLLSEGHTMYYGDAKLVMGWFQKLGQPLPLGVNIADFILDLANGDINDEERSGDECRQEFISAFLSYSTKHHQGVTCESDIINFNKEGEAAISPTSSSSTVRASETFEIESDSPDDGSERWGASFVEQVKVLSSRTVRTRRFETFSLQKFIQLIGLAIIAGLLWWQAGGKNTLLSASDMSGLLFFELLFTQFSAMFAALFTFPQEFQMMSKERSSGMYRLSAFYISRSASEMPMDCLIPSLFVLIIYWTTGLRPTFFAFLSHWAAMMLSLLTAQSVGLIIGASVMDFKKAQTITTLMMLTMMLTGGFYIRKIPGWLKWLKYCSFIFYGYNLLMKVEFSGRSFEDCGGLGVDAIDVDPSGDGTCIPVTTSLKEALSLAVDVDQSVLVDVLALLGALFVLRVALYEVLKRKTRS
ncbi:hypothetical protein BSKO_02119 [Bryopsis sp. KO-2023]|nr:hypothetical protein BSKO_02119 [Bryopsis sp. KO-2023]